MSPPLSPQPSPGSFRERFFARVADLAAHPRIHVAIAHLGDGTPSHVLERIERRLGRSLPADVRAFYEGVTRVQLVWRILPEGSPPDLARPSPDRTIAEKDRNAWGVPEGDGIVDILSAEEVFLGQPMFPVDNPPETFEVDERELPRHLLHLFDRQSDYRQMALLLEPDRDDIRGIIGDDYFADIARRSIRFSRALALVLDNLGYQGRTSEGPRDEIESEIGVVPPGPSVWRRYADPDLKSRQNRGRPVAPRPTDSRGADRVPAPEVIPGHGDPIDEIVARLASTPFWTNGTSPKLAFPETAPIAEVVAKVFALSSFDRGRVLRHHVLEERAVDIAGMRCHAVLVGTDQGRKVVILRSGLRTGWWSRVYDAGP